MVSFVKESMLKYKIAIRIVIILSMIFVVGCVATEANNTPANDQKHSNQNIHNIKEQNLASCLKQRGKEFLKTQSMQTNAYKYSLAAAMTAHEIQINDRNYTTYKRI